MLKFSWDCGIDRILQPIFLNLILLVLYMVIFLGFWTGKALANSEDPDQTAPRGAPREAV